MKIGDRIALFYTTVTICAITLVVVVFYLFTFRYINKLYDSYLVDKAYLTAQKHWEKDEVDEDSYQLIERKYGELLPQAKEVLLNADSVREVKDSLNKYLTKEQQDRLFSGNPVTFTHNKQMGAALYYPDNEGNFIVLVMSQNNYGREIQQHVLIIMVCLFVFSSILIYFIGRIYSNRIVAPLKHILKELKRIRGNNLTVRLKEPGNKDELDDLIHSLNGMLDRLDAAFKSEKSFVNSASHELNNPLTAIQGECEISLLKERSTGEYIGALQRISTESKRISELIKYLLFLSHQDEDLLKNNMEAIDLRDFLQSMCSENGRLSFVSDITPFIEANPYLLKVALENIMNNACKYSGNEKVDVKLYEKDSHTVIEVEDYGIGIPEEEMERIFQSFYRATNTREYKGHGIGLGLSLKILSVYGGKMEVFSKLNEYTRVVITF